MDEIIPHLRQWLDYDPVTGIFRHRRAGRSGVRAGYVAGAIRSDGYVTILIDGHRYYAHRVAWLWVYNRWPLCGIDHIDRNPLNNAISNLREATQSQNLANQQGRYNRTGIKGVYLQKGRYRVQVWKSGKAYSFGLFDTIDEAALAASEGRRKLYGEFARSTGEKIPCT